MAHRAIQLFSLLHAVNAHPISHVIVNGHRQRKRPLGQQAGLLAHRGDVNLGRIDIDPIQKHLTRNGHPVYQVQQAIQALEQSSLAAARRPHDHRDLVPGDSHIDILQSLVAARITDIQIVHAHMLFHLETNLLLDHVLR